MKKAFGAFVAVLFFAVPAMATTSGPETVTAVKVWANGDVYVTMSSSTSCAATFKIVGADAGAKSMLSVVTSAYLAGKKIVADSYTGPCANWGWVASAVSLQEYL